MVEGNSGLFGLSGKCCVSRQKAAGFQIGQNHFFGWVDNFCSFGHKVNAHKNDQIGSRFCRLLRQTKTVANVIGNVLKVALHIVMAENDRILFLFQAVDFIHQFQLRANLLFNISFFIKHLPDIYFFFHLTQNIVPAQNLGCKNIKI